MRAIRHSLLMLTAIMAIALLPFVTGQARADDGASVVSPTATTESPAGAADSPAVSTPAGTDTSQPTGADTTPGSPSDTAQSDSPAPPTPSAPATAPAPVSPPAPPTPPAPAATPSAPATPPAPPAPPTPPEPPAAPATPAPVTVVNTTTEVASQVQISGCLSHCQGGSQTQVASQRNQTVQSISGAPHPAPVSTPKQPPSSSRIKQVQVGCVRACFGTTSTGSGDQFEPHELSELMQALGVSDPADMRPGTDAVQSTVSQTSSQLQIGPGGEAGGAALQAQTATQTNLTVQALPADLVFNSITQAIAQIQIGCLFYCHGTSQYQLATQSNTTVEFAPSAATVSTETASGVSNVTDQLIWQLQIGCLMWCWDATQDQIASSDDVLVVLPTPLPPPPAQPSDPARPSDPGPSAPTEPAPSDPAAPPGAAKPPLPPQPSPAPAASQAASPPAIGAGAPAPARSAIHVGGGVSGSVASGAWSEKLATAGWTVTRTASPAHPSSAAPLSAAPRVAAAAAPAPAPAVSPVGAVSFSAQNATSPVAGSSHTASPERGSPPHHGKKKSDVGATIGGAAVDRAGDDTGLALGLAVLALIALLAGVVAWRRRIG